jgi:shikimate dehydrogenase
VSTIPAEAQGEAVLRVAATAPVVFDVVYDPWPTPLARLASSTGLTLVSGLDLLVHQAALQVELMAGVPQAPLAAMRAAGEAALS